MNKQRYTVEIVSLTAETQYYPDCSKREATRIARAEAAREGERQVYVSWVRCSDGQQGYLNANGDHVITGSPW